MVYKLSRSSTKIAAEIVRSSTRGTLLTSPSSARKFTEAKTRALTALDRGDRIVLGSPLAEDIQTVLNLGASASPAAASMSTDLERNLRGLPTVEQVYAAAFLSALSIVAAVAALIGFVVISDHLPASLPDGVAVAGLWALVALLTVTTGTLNLRVGHRLRRRYPASTHGLYGARKLRHQARFQHGVAAATSA